MQKAIKIDGMLIQGHSSANLDLFLIIEFLDHLPTVYPSDFSFFSNVQVQVSSTFTDLFPMSTLNRGEWAYSGVLMSLYVSQVNRSLSAI